MRISRNLASIISSVFLLSTLFSFHVCDADTQAVYCPNNTVYDNSTANGRNYRNNLDSLLSALVSNAYQPSGFYNYTANINGDAAAYGLFLCRGDINASECGDCLTTARTDVLRLCPDRNQVTIWYDICMLRYSNESIFSRLDISIAWYFRNTKSSPYPGLMNRILGNRFDEIVAKAAYDSLSSGKKFAVHVADYAELGITVYSLGQCTPDLSGLDCETCLREAIRNLPNCCNSSQGGSVLLPSCNIMYESAPFFNQVQLQAPPPESPATGSGQGSGGVSTRTIVSIVAPIVAAVVAFAVVFSLVKKAKRKENVTLETSGVSSIPTDAESLQYNFSQVQDCTNYFSVENRIGEGGFGVVYKGTMLNGQLVAVKRLSKGSKQGTEEFANEIALVAKLQHRNLVRLLGYCLDGEEKLLIYEYVPNKSLDYFLFDPGKQSLLNWETRYQIIGGIARGLLYLHEDSRIKVIHRDLKASNVLLDKDMNPKIADFGMAKYFEIDQSEGNTNRIAGTFGYMAPEYALHGLFSVKSDVFSFGVIILEIISGKKNSSFLQSHDDDHRDDLLSYGWRQWKDGKSLELLDPSIGESYDSKEVIQCIHIGLLCVQGDVELRPTMASVVRMLNNYSVTLQNPNQPAFFGYTQTQTLELSHAQSVPLLSTPVSINEASITELHPR